MKTTGLLCSAAFALILFACGQQPAAKRDNPTSGTISIAVDEALRPIAEAEVKAFEAIYTKAHFNVHYVSETEAVNLLLLDSVRLAFLTRPLSKEENDELRKQMMQPQQSIVAHESVALILNKSAKDTVFTIQQLTDILTDAGSKPGDPLIVFDNAGSGIVRYVKDSVLRGKPLSSKVSALNDNPSVIDYVSKNENALGLIGGAWISDRDDSTTNVFLNSVIVAGVEKNGQFYQPYQAYVAQHLYPLSRNIVISTREGHSGLGSGFMSFVAGDKGQRIILKSGLVPATMPVRVVQVSKGTY